jgi:hypothetical protein
MGLPSFHRQASGDAVDPMAATIGSTFAWAHVKPRSVHSDVVCLMPRSFIILAISATASS